MKNTRSILLLLTIALVSAGAALAQKASEIASIRADVRAIDKNLKSYTKTIKDIDGISLEGTEATYYVSGKGLKKIVAESFGETYRNTTTIYYSGELPIFALTVFKKYDTQIGLKKTPKVVRTEERRFYYSGDQLIKHMIGQETIGDTDARFRDNNDEFKKIEEILKAAYAQ